MTIRRLLIVVVEGEKEAIETLCTTVHNIGKVLTSDIKLDTFASDIPDKWPIDIYAEMGTLKGNEKKRIVIPLQEMERFHPETKI